jgi:hypothetical protein
MLGIFKKFWSKSDTDTVFAAPPASSKPAVPVTVTTKSAPGGAARTSTTARVPVPPSRVPAVKPVAKSSAAPAAPHPSRPGCVNVTLGAIEPSLPEQLRHKIAGALHETVPVPIDQVVPQLQRGSVALTVRQLRTCAPELLACLNGHDDIAVALPLGEIVPQLDKTCFTRREPLKRLIVPDEVSSIFTPTSDGAAIAINAHVAEPAKAAPTPARNAPVKPVAPAKAPTPKAPVPMPAPVATPAVAAAPAPVAAAPAPIAMAAPFAAVEQAPAEPAIAQPERKIALSADALASLAAARPGAPAAAPAPSTPAPAAAPAARASAPAAAPQPGTRPAPAAPAAAAAIPAPFAPAAQPGRSTTPTNPLPLPLQKVFDTLPQEVRVELADTDIPTSTLNIPLPLIEAGLKSGRVIFAWNDLAGWLQPPLPRPPSRSAGEILVELPLKIIAPAFMAHHRSGAAQKKADVGDNIPDLFQSANGEADTGAAVPFGGPVAAPRAAATPAQMPAPSAPRAAVATPVAASPAPAPAPAVPAAAPRVVEPALPSLDEVCGHQGQRYSPKQILQNVSRLPGVSGALVALTDGLLVASGLPANTKSDTVAAFLPQMFGRMSQYTKELGLGGLQSMVLHVEGGCWQVFKQPNIYFAVCGKTGEAMPLNLLTQIAAELSKQTV